MVDLLELLGAQSSLPYAFQIVEPSTKLSDSSSDCIEIGSNTPNLKMPFDRF
jgi:hypothetical protein